MTDPQEQPSCPHILTKEEFERDLAPTAIVESTIYRNSTHVLTGASKTGKSWLGFQLVLCVCAGIPFLDLKTTACRVLLISLEMTAGMVRDRMEGICKDVGVPPPSVGETLFVVAPTIDSVPQLNLASKDGQEHLRQLIDKSNAEMVVLDTLYRFIPGIEINSNAEMGVIFGDLNEVAQSTGAAIIMIDHVAKGEQQGPVSHSAIGAQIKGGASRVIMGLRRTSKEAGGRWQLDVESHFGSWDEPISYERPVRSDGEPGEGCTRCSSVRAFNLTLDAVTEIFRMYGQVDESGRRYFASKRALTEGLKSAGLASGNGSAADLIRAITRDFCLPAAVPDVDPERPFRTSQGKRNATLFTLDPSSSECDREC